MNKQYRAVVVLIICGFRDNISVKTVIIVKKPTQKTYDYNNNNYSYHILLSCHRDVQKISCNVHIIIIISLYYNNSEIAAV